MKRNFVHRTGQIVMVLVKERVNTVVLFRISAVTECAGKTPRHSPIVKIYKILLAFCNMDAIDWSSELLAHFFSGG